VTSSLVRSELRFFWVNFDHSIQTHGSRVGLLLVTSFNCAYVLIFSNLMLVPLGWGHRLPAYRRRRGVVCQLAPRRPTCHRRPEVHPVQGPHAWALSSVSEVLIHLPITTSKL
jgi:hypothetical protein